MMCLSQARTCISNAIFRVGVVFFWGGGLCSMVSGKSWLFVLVVMLLEVVDHHCLMLFVGGFMHYLRYLCLFVEGLMRYLRYLCLFTYSGFQHILCCVFVLFFFVMCPVLSVLLDFPFYLPLRYSLTFISLLNKYML